MSVNRNLNDSSPDEISSLHRLSDATHSSDSDGRLNNEQAETERDDSLPKTTQPQTGETVSYVAAPVEPKSSDNSHGNNRANNSIDEEATVIRTASLKRPIAEESLVTSHAGQSIQSIAEQLVGQHLDHLKLESLVASGGMGAVFKGRDTQLERIVAVKVIPEANRDADSQRRFRTEAQAAAKLDHPNIARIYYVGKSQQWNYIVLEFVEGTNLRDWVAINGPMSIDDTVFIIRQIANALEHAFKRGVVHRDIKPSNVLLTPDGVAKVVDMGLARDASANRQATDETSSGTTLGTFDYISPEQAKDPRQADIRSDLYSLGCTMYYCLLGRPPFKEGTALQKLLSHGSDLPPDPRTDRPDVSRDMHSILYRLMAKSPAERYQRPIDLASDLTRLAEIESLDKSRSVTQKVSTSISTINTPLERAIPWIVGVIAILAITFWLALDSFFAPDPDLSHAIATPGSNIVELDNAETDIGEPSGASTGIGQPALNMPAADSSDEVLDSSEDSGLSDSIFSEPVRNSEAIPPSQPDNRENSADGSIGSTRGGAGDSNVGVTPGESPRLPTGIGRSESPTELSENDTVWVIPSTTPASRIEIDLTQQITTTTFDEAIRLANFDERLKKILIAADAVNITPLEITSSKLLIAAAPNFAPQLSWSIGKNSVTPADFIMPLITAVECQLELEGIYLNIKNRPSEILERSFKLTQALVSLESSSLTMRNCAVTVEQSQSFEPSASIHPISIVKIEASTTRSRRDDSVTDEIASIPTLNDEPTKLTLRDSIFRGDASGIEIPLAVRSEIEIENCLIALRDNCLLLGGSPADTKSRATIRVDMSDSTVAVGQRFARVEFDSQRSRRIFLRREAKKCVFWAPNDSALIDLVGFDDIRQAEEVLLLTGEDNVYDKNVVSVVDLIRQTGATSRLQFEEAEPNLLRDKAFETSVRWQSTPPSVESFSRSLPDDYAQIDGTFMPGPVLGRLPQLDY